jgi:hypothetical protein
MFDFMINLLFLKTYHGLYRVLPRTIHDLNRPALLPGHGHVQAFLGADHMVMVIGTLV